MPSTPPAREQLERLVPAALLAGTVGLLAVGGLTRAAGASTAVGDGVWIATGAIGAAYSLWMTAKALYARRIGVDVIALLALVGALLVGEYLAAGVIAVMVTSGRALEGWAAGRAHRDLHALLSRAPSFAHRYAGGSLHTVSVDQVVPGDRLMVGTGELVPADGNLLGGAVLDESALTGESLPVERTAGDPVRSGVANAGTPFDMTATAGSAESTYAGVARLVSEAEASQPPFVRLADRYALLFLALTLVAGAAAWAAAGAARGGGRPRGRDPLPADPRCTCGLGVGPLTFGEAGGCDQGRCGPRAPGALHDAADRQDGDLDDRATFAGGHHHRRYPPGRRAVATGRVPRPNVPPRPRPRGGPRRA